MKIARRPQVSRRLGWRGYSGELAASVDVSLDYPDITDVALKMPQIRSGVHLRRDYSHVRMVRHAPLLRKSTTRGLNCLSSSCGMMAPAEEEEEEPDKAVDVFWAGDRVATG